ncbi:aldehyde dehydrogenase [Sphingobium amiense]|uniref:Aldehyde dehydrogenase n=1 Tax=Sphingobium amiense TaxID=135719 RepID=A0A494W5W5_9SPHN|nr:aldehyde dehydrogenase [Sphingobium amiense]BBD99974.1 aldehyde dehydrogenase [Sphingobium amiense]
MTEQLTHTIHALRANDGHALFIDGVWRPSTGDRLLDVIAPHDEQLLLRYAEASTDDVDEAVAAARRAFDEGPWPGMTPEDRADILMAVAKRLEQRLPELAAAWTGQVGAVIDFTRKASHQVPGLFAYYADLARSYPFVETRARPAGGAARIVKEPAGVCAAITPWNAPLVLLCYKVAAGLAAGCTFVAKPSPETPVDAYILTECLEDAGLPPGVFNLVTGGREVGDHLVRHPGIDKVSFTGSTAAGKVIARACADRLARVSLELGGKSAALIMDDAPLADVLPSLVPYSMPITGQVCFSLTRILVPRGRHDEVVGAYLDAVNGMRVGDPFESGVAMGPLSLERQRERVESYVARGVEEGAHLLRGGTRPQDRNRGWFFEPTVFTGVTTDMTIAREEIFGPVVSFIACDDEEDMIAKANATSYGLHGAIYTADTERAEHVARRLRTGSVAFNSMAVDIAMPFGGFRESGIGREGGIEGLENYLETKTLYLSAV